MLFSPREFIGGGTGLSVLSSRDICERLQSQDVSRRLVVTPVLDPSVQIGPSSVDLRLGMRFLVDIRTREPLIRVDPESRDVGTFFDATYREFGQTFILYPGQLVLACSFEYIRLPLDLSGQLVSRSSLNRLGISFSTIVQPGYTGTLTLDLSNSTSNPIELVVGMRIAQLQLYQLCSPIEQGYLNYPSSKYVADTGPKVSAAARDEDLDRLLGMCKDLAK